MKKKKAADHGHSHAHSSKKDKTKEKHKEKTIEMQNEPMSNNEEFYFKIYSLLFSSK